MRRVVVPRGAGVGSAIGFLRAPIAYELTRSFHQRIGTLDVSAVNELLGRHALAGAIGGGGRRRRPAALRNPHCIHALRRAGHEVGVELPVRIETPRLEADGAGVLMEAFEGEYERLYERTIPNLDAEILTWVLVVATDETSESETQVVDDARGDTAASSRTRAIMDTGRGEFIEVSEFQRADLGAGSLVRGPAVIVEDDTTTVVTERFDARVHPRGYIVMERRGVDTGGGADA